MENTNAMKEDNTKDRRSADSATPAQTNQNQDIDETTVRQDEYNKFSKDTIQPQPQIQHSK